MDFIVWMIEAHPILSGVVVITLGSCFQAMWRN